MATCYFLQHYDWAKLPHRFINVSAGTPRSCKPSMAEIMEKKLDELRPLDKAIVCRVVMNEDVVVSYHILCYDVSSRANCLPRTHHL